MIILPFSRFTISGSSMLPTLKSNQSVLTFNWFINLKTGDMVVVKVKEKLMVKRIQKISGQKYFVIGDNLSKSTDSREFGYIPKKQIIGKVIYSF